MHLSIYNKYIKLMYFNLQATRAEVKIANWVVQHNIPLAVTDHLSPMFKDIFPDSQIAKSYASARTKTTCILNGSLAPYFKACLVATIKSAPFSLAIDGSNDSGLEKMNPMTIRYFDARRVKTQLLDMCLTSGVHFNYTSHVFNHFVYARKLLHRSSPRTPGWHSRVNICENGRCTRE